MQMSPGNCSGSYIVLKRPCRFLKDHGLKDPNMAVGEAHESFCKAKRDVELLEEQLKEAGARAKFESA